MTQPTTASFMRDASTPDALARARRRLLTNSAGIAAGRMLSDNQLCELAEPDWTPPVIENIDAQVIENADPILRALLSESLSATLARLLALERPHGSYDDTPTVTKRSPGPSLRITNTATSTLPVPPSATHTPSMQRAPGWNASEFPQTPSPSLASSPTLHTPPIPSPALSPTRPSSTSTGTPLVEESLTRASHPPSYSPPPPKSAWTRPSMPWPVRPSHSGCGSATL